MSTKRCEHLLRRVRQRSDNLDYGTQAGISDEQIVDYLNDSISKLQNLISEQHGEIFSASTELSLVARQEEYTLPDDMLEGAGLLLVEYQFDAQYWKKLNKLTIAERSSGSHADPFGYIRKGRSLLLRPIPYGGSTNTLRIEYVKRLDRIGKRRAKVLFTQGNGTTIDFLEMDKLTYSTGDDYKNTDLQAADVGALSECDYVCIVDRDGNMIERNIPIDGVEDGMSYQLVIPSHIVMNDIPAGSYVVCEKDTSTHQIELDPNVERYVIEYAVWRCKTQDASNEAYEQQGHLKSLQNDILNSYAVLDETVQFIPELSE